MNFIWLPLLVAITVAGTMGAPGPDCSPAALQDLPMRARNMCAALYQFSNALQAYIDDPNNNYPYLPDGSPMKRQDVDHVFLRFGRRR